MVKHCLSFVHRYEKTLRSPDREWSKFNIFIKSMCQMAVCGFLGSWTGLHAKTLFPCLQWIQCWILDLRSAYWQTALEESLCDKTAFSTSSGHWEFVRMPFGIVIAPASFQRMISMVLAPMTRCANPCMDDILILAVSVDTCIQFFDEVLTRLG